MNSIGKIIGISELNVKVLILENNIKIGDILACNIDGSLHRFEVVEIDSKFAKTIPFETVRGLKKGIELEKIEGGLSIEYSDEILGRVFNAYGDLIDNSKIENPIKKNVYEKKLEVQDININSGPLWTGIKVIDFYAPIQKGYKMGLLGGAGVRKNCFNKRVNKQCIQKITIELCICRNWRTFKRRKRII